MLDFQLDKDGDLDVSALGDISLTQSVQQAILVRLRWIYNEWRLGPELGFPWFEDVLVKNPNTARIKQDIRGTIMQVDEVKSATVQTVNYDPAKRSLYVKYTAATNEETFTEEVRLYG